MVPVVLTTYAGLISYVALLYLNYVIDIFPNYYVYTWTGLTVPYSYYYFTFYNLIMGSIFLITGIMTMTYCLFDIFDPDFNQFKKDNDIMFSCITTSPPLTFFGNYY